MTFVPSPEQQNIFDAVLNGRRNIAIKAGAGSGKTTTLKELAKRLPLKHSKVYCAFNADIVKEVQPSLDGTGMEAKTFHSLGLGALYKHLSPDKDTKITLDAEAGKSKYKDLVTVWIASAAELHAAITLITEEEFPEDPDTDFKGNREKRYWELFKGSLDMFVELLRFLRLKLIEWDDYDALHELVNYYRLDNDIDYYSELTDIVVHAVPTIMKQAEALLTEKHQLDFTDQIYWPVRWDLRFWGRMWVFVDECQDLSPMQRALVKKLVYERGGRIVLVGDENQAIYEFAGADSDSFTLSVKMFDALVLPLSVTRRSDKIIVQHANRLVPDFHALPDASRGKIVWVDEDRLTNLAEPGDMIICRVKAPLVKTCIDLIASGKAATILGNDIARALIKIIERLTKRDGYTFETILETLDKYEEDQTTKLLAKEDHAQISNLNDQCLAVRVVIETAQAGDYDTLVAYIERLFSDRKKGNVIILCTGHKSKGLEADRVFLLSPEKMPLRFPDQRAESLKQEFNIEYVAITRAKHTLVYLTNPTFKKYNEMPPYAQTNFDDLNWDAPAKLPAVIDEDDFDEDDDLIEEGEYGAWQPVYALPDGDELDDLEEPEFIPTPLTTEPPPLNPLWEELPLDTPLVDLFAGLDEDDEPEPVRLFVQPKGDSSVQLVIPPQGVISKLRKAMEEFDAAYDHAAFWAAAVEHLDLCRHEPVAPDTVYAIETRYGVAIGEDWMITAKMITAAPVTDVSVEETAFRASRNLTNDLKTFQLVKTQERLMLMIKNMSPAELERAARLLDGEFKQKAEATNIQPALL